MERTVFVYVLVFSATVCRPAVNDDRLEHMLTEKQNQRNITGECVASEIIVSDWRMIYINKYVAVVGTSP